ncbi:MAG: Uma2 family endonuclease [Planctomycetia bacterium]|nr:Uma2 family endonuclease [Planctomycetia bacterium]
MSSFPKKRISPEEYLAIERRAETKSEYYNGEMFAMTGASREHSLIAGNIFRVLATALLGRKCEIHINDMRVKVSRTGLYTYPDVVVACGEARYEDAHVDTLLNPVLIVEVLSPSTEMYDRGAKFRQYRETPSLKEYVLVAQDAHAVESFVRQPNGQWLLKSCYEPAGVVRFESVESEIPMSEIYRQVEIPPGGTEPSSA